MTTTSDPSSAANTRESAQPLRSPTGRVVRIAIALAIIAALGWYIWFIRHRLAVILEIDPRYIPPMVGVQLLSLWVNGVVARDLVAEFGVRLSPLEWYGLAAVNALGNYLPLPQGGAVARGVYLKRVHRLSYTTYAATLIVTYVSAIALYGVVGLCGLAVLHFLGRPSPLLLWLAFTALAASLVLFTPLARRFPLPARLANLNSHLGSLRRRHLIARIVVLQAALVALTTMGLWLGCHALPVGRSVTWSTTLMLGLMVLASGIINVTPGNIGVEQAFAEGTARLLNVPLGVGLLASGIYRAVAIVTIFILGPVFSAILARRRPAENPQACITPHPE